MLLHYIIVAEKPRKVTQKVTEKVADKKKSTATNGPDNIEYKEDSESFPTLATTSTTTPPTESPEG